MHIREEQLSHSSPKLKAALISKSNEAKELNEVKECTLESFQKE